MYEEKNRFSCETGLVVADSLSFCLTGKSLISFSLLKVTFTGYSITGWKLFKILNILLHTLLDCGDSEKSAVNLMVFFYM